MIHAERGRVPGISVPHAAELRTRLAEADATFMVVKNRLAKRAAEEAGTAKLHELFDGPIALTSSETRRPRRRRSRPLPAKTTSSSKRKAGR